MSTQGGCFECWADLRQAETVCAASVQNKYCGELTTPRRHAVGDGASCAGATARHQFMSEHSSLIPLSFIFSPNLRNLEKRLEYNVKI